MRSYSAMNARRPVRKPSHLRNRRSVAMRLRPQYPSVTSRASSRPGGRACVTLQPAFCKALEAARTAAAVALVGLVIPSSAYHATFKPLSVPNRLASGIGMTPESTPSGPPRHDRQQQPQIVHEPRHRPHLTAWVCQPTDQLIAASARDAPGGGLEG